MIEEQRDIRESDEDEAFEKQAANIMKRIDGPEKSMARIQSKNSNFANT